MDNHREWIQHLFTTNSLVELRYFGDRIASGIFDDMDSLIAEVQANYDSGNFYLTLNQPRLLRPTNKLIYGGYAMRDADIKRITHIPLDFDPVRPTGTPSRATELADAFEARRITLGHLDRSGWPEPVWGLSGNGYHAVYATDLPADAETKRLFDALYGLLHHYSPLPTVKFDRAVRNPARIWRLYGTVNRKGEETDARRWRQALCQMPEHFGLVTRQHLEDVAEVWATHQAATARRRPSPPAVSGEASFGRGNYSTLDVVGWFEGHGLYRRDLGSYGQSQRHAVTCPWTGEHTVDDGENGRGTVVFENRGSWPGFHCSHDHCTGRTIRDVIGLLGDADAFCGSAWRASS